MSADELLNAARILPRPERLRLLHALLDDVARPDLPPDNILQRALVLDFAHNPPPELLDAMYQMLGYDKNGNLPA
ncbi:hypothetical protein ETAA1_21070 [Urbifossiella limnaea]|uniref:Uncharacterized protein n=1 Tax=Urbifossiella limnaea TaxID=2528023 RepID=A0A517XRQ7_9BACT|nr:hypothetical protein ETAA1_21070 [Urbifossiella limnaea]